MSDEARVEEPEVYVPPMLAEAGAFAEETQGGGAQGIPEGDGTYFSL
jgi:hypothetical protein